MVDCVRLCHMEMLLLVFEGYRDPRSHAPSASRVLSSLGDILLACKLQSCHCSAPCWHEKNLKRTWWSLRILTMHLSLPCLQAMLPILLPKPKNTWLRLEFRPIHLRMDFSLSFCQVTSASHSWQPLMTNTQPKPVFCQIASVNHSQVKKLDNRMPIWFSSWLLPLTPHFGAT